MAKAFAIDISICNGCYCCQIACKDEHVANDWTPYAKPQPDTGQFWLKQNEFVRGTVPKVKMHYLPILCMHCDEAPCIPACPIEGAIYKRDDGLVIIDPVKCTGCRNCVDACPYHVIFFNEDLNIAQKCTGCAHLLADGWKEPRWGRQDAVETDSYGDFWFEGLNDGKYNLKIKKGKKTKSFAGLNTAEKDINLEDIPLT